MHGVGEQLACSPEGGGKLRPYVHHTDSFREPLTQHPSPSRPKVRSSRVLGFEGPGYLAYRSRRAGESEYSNRKLGRSGHPGGHPTDLNQMTRGCLAASGVCFISHRGRVQPCGYLPLEAGDLRRQGFRDVWENSPLFNDMRDLGGLEGKCGYCEFKQVCMGCRARAFGVTGDYHNEEPFCVYEPNPERRGGIQLHGDTRS